MIVAMAVDFKNVFKMFAPLWCGRVNRRPPELKFTNYGSVKFNVCIVLGRSDVRYLPSRNAVFAYADTCGDAVVRVCDRYEKGF